MKAVESQAGKILEIKLSQIKPTQGGNRAKDVGTLASSIKAVGLLVPLIVRPVPDDFDKAGNQMYQLVDGHRRLAAVKANKTETVRVIEVDPLTSDDKMGVLQLTANVHRLQLTAFEEAEAIAKLRKAGRSSADPGQCLPPGDTLIDSWCNKIGNSHAKLLRELAKRYPHDLTKAELAEAVGESAGGGGFANKLGRMRTLGLITYPGPGRVRASDLLFAAG